jgi:hypothetical protein
VDAIRLSCEAPTPLPAVSEPTPNTGAHRCGIDPTIQGWPPQHLMDAIRLSCEAAVRAGDLQALRRKMLPAFVHCAGVPVLVTACQLQRKASRGVLLDLGADADGARVDLIVKKDYASIRFLHEDSRVPPLQFMDGGSADTVNHPLEYINGVPGWPPSGPTALDPSSSRSRVLMLIQECNADQIRLITACGVNVNAPQHRLRSRDGQRNVSPLMFAIDMRHAQRVRARKALGEWSEEQATLDSAQPDPWLYPAEVRCKGRREGLRIYKGGGREFGCMKEEGEEFAPGKGEKWVLRRELASVSEGAAM